MNSAWRVLKCAPHFLSARSIARQLRWCAAVAADAPREERSSSFSLGLIATREFDRYGARLERASLINEVPRETEAFLEPSADATLEDFAGKRVQSGFLHFSSTCRTEDRAALGFADRRTSAGCRHEASPMPSWWKTLSSTSASSVRSRCAWRGRFGDYGVS